MVKVGGYIDITTSDELEKVIESLLASNNYNIIVDLDDVDYISSRGWSIFLSKLKEIRDNGGDLKLARMKEAVYEVYVVLEFFWFLKVYETLDAAISDFELGVPPMP
jgi:anti-sigma B factor antagonist